jgi:CBS domain-containing protein
MVTGMKNGLENGIVRKWMSERIVFAQPDTHLHDARRMMTTENIRVLPVIEDGNLLGIVTKRDLLRSDPSIVMRDSWEQYRQVGKLTVSHIMTHCVTTISEDADVSQAARVMLENKISALPVIDSRQNVTGMITASDMYRLVIEMVPSHFGQILVNDYMTRHPFTISPLTTLLEAHRIMGVKRIRSLPVTNEGNLVGIVTRSDLLSADPSSLFTKGQQTVSKRIQNTPIEYIMTSSPLTVGQNVSISEAAAIMMEHKIHSLPVLDDDQNLVGIITESDIFRFIVQNF